MYNYYTAVIKRGEGKGTYDVILSTESPHLIDMTGSVSAKYCRTVKEVCLRDLMKYMTWKFPQRMSFQDRRSSKFGEFKGVQADLKWLREFIDIEFNFHFGDGKMKHSDANFYPSRSKVHRGLDDDHPTSKPWHLAKTDSQ